MPSQKKDILMLDFSKIRTIDDFPTPGIKFYDITTLLNDGEAYRCVIDDMLAVAKSIRPDVIVALETRGFFFGPTLAYLLGIPFVPIRKKGKLPAATFSESYNLEYGTDSIEIHQDAIAEGKRILLLDDVLATGGTMSAAVRLMHHFNPASIDTLFLIELVALEGRKKLDNITIHSLLQL
ncbi:MAG: adenine phosphoribosyltransferase [Bacteroidales bacterium]|nr:adenine phosphoribosyltransferase [Bacteroidales bacterium]